MDLTAPDAAQPCGLSVRSVKALYTSVCVSAWLGSAPLSLLSQASLRPMSPLSAPSVSGTSEVAMDWLIWVWTSTSGSITAATNSSRAADTSTASSLFGAMPNIGWRSFMACDVTSSRCISRSLSLRFNHRLLNLYKTLLKLFKNEPL